MATRRDNLLAQSGSSSEWVVPVRWFWKADEEWTAYPEPTSDFIETHYKLYRANNTPTKVLTEPGLITRFVDDKKQSYWIDYERLVQRHPSTGFERKLQRRPLPVHADSGATWLYYNQELQKFLPYDSSLQADIEAKYAQFTQANGTATITIRVPGRSEPYSIDFDRGIQTNTTTKNQLKITRKVSSSATEVVTFPLRNCPPPVLAQIAANRLAILKLLKQVATESSHSSKQGTAILDKLDLAVTPAGITLSAQGASAKILPLLSTRLKKHLFRFDEISLGEPSYQGANARVWVVNPRLLQLTTHATPIVGNSRDDCMLLLAHACIWQCRCTIYGGFVRDWVVRGEEANDIDVLLPSSRDLETVAAKLIEFGVKYHISFRESKQNGQAYGLIFRGRWAGDDIRIDLVSPSLPKASPGVDSDAGNLCITPAGELAKKVPDAGGPALSLMKCVRHALKKQFVFLYDLTDANNQKMVVHRLKKYLEVKEWTCISPVPPHILAFLSPTARARVKPEPKYNRNWSALA